MMPLINVGWERNLKETSKRILETERLILREFDLRDAAFILELLNSPDWIEFIGDKNVKTLSDAAKYLEDGPLKSYRENEFGLSMVELKYLGVPVGMCGLKKRETLDDVDIGFAMLPGFVGIGYGFEIVSATLDYAKNKLGFKRLVAITDENNAASIALLKKIGLEYEGKTDASLGDGELLLFGKNFEISGWICQDEAG